MIEYIYGRGRAIIYRWDNSTDDEKGFVTGMWKVLYNVPNYP